MPEASAAAPPGALDPSFGVNGVVRRNIGGAFVSTDYSYAVALQSDGKVVIAGTGGVVDSNFVLMRVLADGSADPSFGVNGVANTSLALGFDGASAVALQPDGKIVAGGFTTNPGTGARVLAIVRYRSDGSLDSSFSGDGIVSDIYFPVGKPVVVNGVAVQSDGKIVAIVEGSSGSTVFAGVLRLNADGSLDTSFGAGAMTTVPGRTGRGIALQADGRILLVGTATASTTMSVARLTTAGTLDTTFGGTGIVEVKNHTGSDDAEAVVVGPDGRITIGGAGSSGNGGQFALARLFADGSLDSSFGGGGHVNTTISGIEDVVRGLALQTDGKLLAVGGSYFGGSRPWVIARYAANGALDTSFASAGIATASLATTGAAFGVAVNGDGAYVTGVEGTSGDYVVLRVGTGAVTPPTTTTQSPTTTSTLVVTTVSTTTAIPNITSFGSRFVAAQLTRLLDTRANGADGKLGARGIVDVAVIGVGRAPRDASAVVVNVTATDAEAPGYLTVWPAQSPRPDVSSLNVANASGTVANLVTAPLSSSGALSIFSEAGAHVIVDLVGYYVPVAGAVGGGRFQPLHPARVLDTRAAGDAPSIAQFEMAAIAGLPSTGVAAIVANLTATGSANAGFVTAWPRADGVQPPTSNLNADAVGQTRANQIIVGVGDGIIRLANTSGAQLIVDVVGYITSDAAVPATTGLFVPFPSVRVWDTRSGVGARAGIVHAGERLDLSVVDHVPFANPLAVVGNLTATQSVAPGYVTLWPMSGDVRPDVSTINLDAMDQTRANHAIIPVGNGGRLSVYSEAGIEVVLDLAGAFRS